MNFVLLRQLLVQNRCLMNYKFNVSVFVLR
jgi:hypothetical protein